MRFLSHFLSCPRQCRSYGGRRLQVASCRFHFVEIRRGSTHLIYPLGKRKVVLPANCHQRESISSQIKIYHCIRSTNSRRKRSCSCLLEAYLQLSGRFPWVQPTEMCLCPMWLSISQEGSRHLDLESLMRQYCFQF